MKISIVLVVGLGTLGSQSALAQEWGYGRQGDEWRGGWNKLEMCHGCHDMGASLLVVGNGLRLLSAERKND